MTQVLVLTTFIIILVKKCCFSTLPKVDKYSMRDIYREVQTFVSEFRQTLANKTQDEINKQRDARISMQKIEIVICQNLK